MIRLVTKHLDNVEVDTFTGLLVDFAASKNATVIVKGLRTVADFEYEFQMALTNQTLYEELETLFLHSSKEYMFLSSSIVKEIAKYGGCLNGLVPDNLIPIIKSRFENSKY